MSLTKAQLRTNVRANLSDAGVTFYTDDDINQVIQDGYNDTVAYTQCKITKFSGYGFAANLNYYSFADNISDYMATIAIFNRATNQWLRDDISMRDFDRLRRDWEKWRGTPQFWAPHSLKYTAICPCYASVDTEGMDLYYYAYAATLSSDSSSLSDIADDMQDLVEDYSTAMLLESARELSKAQAWWERYIPRANEYKDRSHRAAKYQLLLRI